MVTLFKEVKYNISTLIQQIGLIKISLVAILTILFLIVSVIFSIKRPSPELKAFNTEESNQCNSDSDCYVQTCTGYCLNASGGIACVQGREFWEKFKGNECFCMQNKCKWGHDVLSIRWIYSKLSELFIAQFSNAHDSLLSL